MSIAPIDNMKLRDLYKYWGMGGPHGLFKRSTESLNENMYSDDEGFINNLGWWGLSGPHGLFKKSIIEPDDEPIKRGAYSFGNKSLLRISKIISSLGLGKRSSQYSFGLGKRQYSFGLGKRSGQYSFGLGK